MILKNRLGFYLLVYGFFILLCGMIGYHSLPPKATSLLVSASLCGSLMGVLGIFSLRGVQIASKIATWVVAVLGIVFLWRASLVTMAVKAGQNDKAIVACVLTAMAFASLAMIVAIYFDARRSSAAGKTPQQAE